MSANGDALVTITIDGKEVKVASGELLIKVAQEHGTYIPRFCWHERMKPVGMCRMCLVEVEGVRGLPPACTTPVTDGMVVHTTTPQVRKVQDGVLELLLINHPLDCPVCDRGGECPLQDTTLAFGPGESRFVEEKRHWEKPIPVSDLVLLDRERCIQCARCTRFADEIAGDPLISFGERGGYTEITTFPDEPFASYFSGNTVQVCPVGALTAQPYRFKARPWDLDAAETSCLTCAVQCRGALESASNQLVRLLGVDSDPVNQGWLCDKGRYGYEAINAENRVRYPMVRKSTGADGSPGELVECSWPEALDAVADGIQRALDLNGPRSVALIGGARGTNEDAYAWARLAKGVLRTDNVDAQLGDGLPAAVALGLPHALINDLDTAAAIVLLGPDLKEELPVLYLRVKKAAVEAGVPLIEIAPRDTGLSRYASARLRPLPGEQADTARKLAAAINGTPSANADIDVAAALLVGRDGDLVVVLGRGDLAESADVTVGAAAALSIIENAKFLVALRRANVRGALELGLAPGFLPGRATLDTGRDHFVNEWGGVPEEVGLDALGIFSAAAEGRIHALILAGSDPINDCPDRALARNAIMASGFVVAIDTFLTESSKRADVFLPASIWGEKTGTITNLEGRVQRVAQKVSPDGTAMPDWRIAAELAARLGVEFDLESADEVTEEIARVAPAFVGLDMSLLRRARDGAVIPIASFPDEIHLGRAGVALQGASWDPILPSPEVVPEDTDDNSDLHSIVVSVSPAVQLHEWDGASPQLSTPARDAYALRLIVGRTLYDGGTWTMASPSLSPLVPESVLLVNPQDRDRIGVADGESVRVATGRGSIASRVRGDLATPIGTAFMAFNLPGPGAADLVDATLSVTDIRVESIR